MSIEEYEQVKENFLAGRIKGCKTFFEQNKYYVEAGYCYIILDNLENAARVETKDEEYKKGVELVLKQFKDTLSSKGVEEIRALGETFDPELHEAVSSVQDDSKGEKEIVQEYRKGYKIGTRVIRHSMVVVAN